MNEYRESYEKEISLIELMFFCLKKWRPIVAAMLIAAVLAGVYKFQTTADGSQTDYEVQALGEDGSESESGVIVNPNVESYERMIESWQQEVDTLREYIDSSVIMQLDPYHLDTGYVSFYVDVADADETVLETLLSAYEQFVTDGRLAADLIGVNEDMTESEMQYLIQFEDMDLLSSGINAETGEEGDSSTTQITNNLHIGTDTPNPVFRVRVTADSADHCAAYIEIVKESITNYAAQLERQIDVSCELLILAESQTERIDGSIQNYQNGILDNYTSAFAQVKELETELETVLEEEGATITVGTNATSGSAVKEAVKFAIIGLVLGLFLSVFALVIIYLMSGKLQSTDGFREEFGMPLLGQLTKRPGKKRFLGFIDDWIRRLEEGAYADITYEEQLKIAAANLKTAAVKEQGLKRIMLAGTMARDEAEAFRSMLAPDLDGMELSAYERIVFQASALEDLDSYDGVVFLEKKGASYVKLIKKERDLVADRNVSVLGAIVV